MLAFLPRSSESSAGPVLLFGAGLIGKAIAGHIRARGDYRCHVFPSDWSQPGVPSGHLEAMHLVPRSGTPSGPIDVIWSAGGTGFAVDESGAEAERTSFFAHLEALREFGSRHQRAIRFSLVSSAGGLFEGQRLIRPDSEPAPRRPYGFLKLDMEMALHRAGFARMLIVRPTSVFGYIRPGQRRGLITALIENGIRRRQSEIFGTVSTLRDYIFVDDIAAFISRRLFGGAPAPASETVLLASGKPSSIGEIIHLVEAELRTRIQLHCSLAPSNTAHITYQQSRFPDGHTPTSLPTAVRLISRDYRSSF